MPINYKQTIKKLCLFVQAASLAGKSINSWMDEVLSDAADKVIYAKM